MDQLTPTMPNACGVYHIHCEFARRPKAVDSPGTSASLGLQAVGARVDDAPGQGQQSWPAPCAGSHSGADGIIREGSSATPRDRKGGPP